MCSSDLMRRVSRARDYLRRITREMVAERRREGRRADLVQALKEIFDKDNPVRIVGTRHGEKLYESLVSREEMARVEQMDQYYRIPADNRDLNYAMYVTDGEEEISKSEDYTSHNTRRLEVVELKQLLLSLDFIQRELETDTARAQEVHF